MEAYKKAWLLMTTLLLSCGGGGTAGPSDAMTEAMEVSLPPADGLEQSEGVGPTDGMLLSHDGEGQGPFDASEDVAPEPGEFGWPCSENLDCNSGFCIESPKGKVCTTKCIDTCPWGWTCKNVVIGQDLVSVCVPRFLYLCDPCGENKECNSELGSGDAVCVDFGGAGRFCGAACEGQGDCPDGYDCRQVPDVNGSKSYQCVPEAGDCQCSKRAVELGLSTECYRTNEAGTCTGVRRCTPAGLTECDAKEPKPEECNGLDDDCNGLTDELQGKVECVKSNEFGSCSGKADCVNGTMVNCDAATPAPETCNGLDDDCNGQTDDAICYDGNPCTKDVCDVGTGDCVFQPVAGPCDDGNACTMNDHCENGECVGGSRKSCDDGNPCTDDYCDSGTGECLHNNNAAPCEDGNLCTQNDKCQNGVCTPGQVKDCSDTNPCTLNEHCDPNSGQCVFTSSEGAPCDDGDVCTTGDVCSGGKCVGPHDYCEGQNINCTPGPGQTICVGLQCIPLFGFPQCSCICL